MSQLNIFQGFVQIYAAVYLGDLKRNDDKPCGKMGNKGKMLWRQKCWKQFVKIIKLSIGQIT